MTVSFAYRVGQATSPVVFDHYAGPVRIIHAMAWAHARKAQRESTGMHQQPDANAEMVAYIRESAMGGTSAGMYLAPEGENAGRWHWDIEIDGDLIAQMLQVSPYLEPADQLVFLLWYTAR